MHGNEAADLVKEARLYRRTGHPLASKEMVCAAKKAYPENPIVVREAKRVDSMKTDTGDTWLPVFVDKVGPVTIYIMAAGASWLLFPILFVSAS